MAKKNKRKILVIESKWYKNSSLSVRGIFDMIHSIEGVEVIHYPMDTRQQLISNLDAFSEIVNSGDVIYIASHGEKGKLWIGGDRLASGPSESITLEELADIMGQKFGGCVVILAACLTLAVHSKRLNSFIHQTQIRCLGGYTVWVDWALSAAMDLVVLSGIQSYKNVKVYWKNAKRLYSSLIRATGFRLIFPD